jgi:group I intron endonuclease
LTRRKAQHLCALRGNTHRNRHLQSSFNKYGEENFVYRILMVCDVENLVFFEQVVLDKYNPQYNKRKVAENNSGHKFSDKARKNMSIAHIGNKNPHNKAWREKMSKILKGRPLSKEHRDRISAGRLASPKAMNMYKDKNYKAKHSENMKLIWERRRKGELPMPNYSSGASNEHI